jgi:hypothetical protein
MEQIVRIMVLPSTSRGVHGNSWMKNMCVNAGGMMFATRPPLATHPGTKSTLGPIVCGTLATSRPNRRC